MQVVHKTVYVVAGRYEFDNPSDAIAFEDKMVAMLLKVRRERYNYEEAGPECFTGEGQPLEQS